jgi:hypothetical protein
MIENEVKKVLAEQAVPTKGELYRLKEQLDSLTEKLDELVEVDPEGRAPEA